MSNQCEGVPDVEQNKGPDEFTLVLNDKESLD